MPQEIPRQDMRPAFTLFSILSGAWISRVVQVAAELDLAGLLQDGPKTLSLLAELTHTHPPSLLRLLRTLTALGIFAEREGQVFVQTELSRRLCRDAPGSLYHFALMLGAEWEYLSWRELLYGIETGQPALKKAFGMNVWQYLEAHPQDNHIFNLGMAELSALVNPSILDAYDFGQFHTLVDVGGGTGNFLALLLEHYPSLQGILFDRGSVIADAQALFAQKALTSRCTFKAGNFHTEAPPGADAYLLKFIINDWDDEHARKILSACRRAMPPHGKLIVTEFVLASQRRTVTAALMDLVAFIDTDGGHGRTEADFRALFAQAGFELKRVIPTASDLFLLEGSPI